MVDAHATLTHLPLRIGACRSSWQLNARDGCHAPADCSQGFDLGRGRIGVAPRCASGIQLFVDPSEIRRGVDRGGPGASRSSRRVPAHDLAPLITSDAEKDRPPRENDDAVLAAAARWFLSTCCSRGVAISKAVARMALRRQARRGNDRRVRSCVASPHRMRFRRGSARRAFLVFAHSCRVVRWKWTTSDPSRKAGGGL